MTGHKKVGVFCRIVTEQCDGSRFHTLTDNLQLAAAEHQRGEEGRSEKLPEVRTSVCPTSLVGREISKYNQ